VAWMAAVLPRGYREDRFMIDGLRCYGGMYLYRLEVGGYMIDLIWYLSVTILSYLLVTLTNSKPNRLHDRSNLVLIYYNHILSIRNSNKLETKSVAQVRSLVGRL
jgi:hypothetical protein